MRDIPSTITAAWRAGDFTGARRPMARVTVQQGRMSLFDTAHNLYSSFVFNNPNTPMELPNVRSVRWDRDIATEVATCTVEFYNQSPLPLGQTPTSGDLDRPGYYTPTRGLGRFSSRWGHTPNEWQGMLLPDNILRTYEGYGFDANVCPEDDPFLVQTGVWLIDQVSLSSSGTLVATCRDLGRLLLDQLAYRPIVPDNFYPLSFERIVGGKKPGIEPPQLKETGNVPAGAPDDVPANVTVTPSSRTGTLSWDAVPAPQPESTELPAAVAGGTTYRVPAADSESGNDEWWVRFDLNANWIPVVGDYYRWAAEYLYGPWTDILPGQVGAGSGRTFPEMFDGELGTYLPDYDVVAYRVYINNQVVSRTIGPDETSAVFDDLLNGSVFQIEVSAVYEELATGNVFAGPRSDPLFFSPHEHTNVGVYPTQVESDTRADGTPADGWVRWRYNVAVGEAEPIDWTIVLYQGNDGHDGVRVFEFTGDVSASGDFWAEFDTGYSELHLHNILIFPSRGDQVGAGGLLFAGANTLGWWGSSGEAGEPAPPPPSDGREVVYGDAGGASSAESARIVPTYVQNSNYPYVGTEGAVYGHKGRDAFDSDNGSYWLSVGNSRPDVGYAYEWVEGSVPNVAVAKVDVLTNYRNMMCWVSIMVDGKWLAHDPADVIPYDEDHPVARNGANIPYVHAEVVPGGGVPATLSLRQVYGEVQRVRWTFSNLNDSGKGDYPYRAQVSEVGVHTVKTDGEPEPQPAEPSDVFDSTGTRIKHAQFIVGAGAKPGYYHDYCADVETEILTKRGWLRWDEVEAGDESLAIDPSTGVAGWQVIESVYRKHRKRTLISMESQVHSSLTTPDHRWLVTDQKGRRLWRTTETLRTGHRIPVSAPVDLPTSAKYDDDFVELVAWFWTEGWCSGEHGNACLAQSETANPVHTARIRAMLLRSLGAPGRMLRGKGAMWNESMRDDGVVTFRLSKPVKDALYDVMDADKVVSPDFISALTSAQLELFIERSLDADGWRTEDGRVAISQAHEGRAKSFEMALALAGRPFRTREVKGQFVTHLLRHSVTLPQSAVIEEVEYDDVIWCPTLKHHNWFARRNGTSYFTGNTDVVKLLCAWAGFFWPEDGTIVGCDGEATAYNFGNAPFNIGPNIDPVLGNADSGRVWGDFEQAGVAGVATLGVGIFDKKPLMEGINHVRNILGFLFMVDEEGAVVWRAPNIFTRGNWITNRSTGARRTQQAILVDERVALMELGVDLSSRNVREAIFVGSPDGSLAGVASGWNPNPVGIRRVAGWTDQNFETQAECQLMAEMIALRQLFTYRTNRVQIPANPRIQIDDQIHIYERVTDEGYRHYVKSISSSLDMEAGEWVYELGTHWLGDQPLSSWAFDFHELSGITQTFLQQTGRAPSTAVEEGVPRKVGTTFTFDEWVG